MAKSYQMLKLNCFGKCFSVVFYTDGRSNPFYLYQHSYCPEKHRRLLIRYANFESCLYHLLQMDMPEFRRDVFK